MFATARKKKNKEQNLKMKINKKNMIQTLADLF